MLNFCLQFAVDQAGDLRLEDKKKGMLGSRDVLFEFHLKIWNTDSIGISVQSLL